VTGRSTATQRRELRTLERRRRGRGPKVLQRAVRGGADAVRRAVGGVVAGNRPLVMVLLGAIALSVVMLSGPGQRLLDSRARVDTLALKAEALARENALLEQRQADLEDPRNIELLAREQQGFIRPGEVPYTLIPPEVDRPRIAPPRDTPTVEPPTWYERAWQTVRDWLG
jgi:cell division protein FtsB